MLADAASAESQLEQAPQGGQGRQVAGRRGRRAGARPSRAPAGRHPALPGRARPTSDRALLQPYFLLTAKPVIAVVNLGEDELDDCRRRSVEPRGRASSTASPRCSGCASSSRRRPAASTPPSGPSCSRASAWARARCPASCARPTTCSGCGRSSRPATRRAGRGRSGPAPRRPSAPGVIHSDLQRGFIRAEVIRWDELLEIGSWNKAKELGQAAGRGQGLRGRRRRRPGDPLQRLSLS